MHEVSGVTGAGPILHGIFDYLHAAKGTSWYRTPSQIVERTVHPLTGRLLPDGDPRGVREKFVAGNLPLTEQPSDYAADGKVKLGSEYFEWAASAENSLRSATVVAGAESALRITSPLPGSIYLIDPDVHSSGQIPLVAAGGAQLIWESDSLRCATTNGSAFAQAAPGTHRIRVIDPATGRRAEVEIAVRSL
jgi:membrane carboxypeptidase/penicillin-binding protein PbpC